MTDELRKEGERPTITVTRAALEKQLEKLLVDLNFIQEGLVLLQQQADESNARITELSERFNRFMEYLEDLS